MHQIPRFLVTLRAYFHSGKSITLAKNETLALQTGSKRLTYYISQGYIRAYSSNGRGDQYTHIVYGPGDIFPLTMLISHDRPDATFEAMTEAKLYCQPQETLVADLLSQQHLAFCMLQQTLVHHRIFAQRVYNLEYKYASERLAYRLILLANRFGEGGDDGITIMPPMTHLILGSSLNLSRESVSREMEKLIRKGLVRYNSKRQIVLTDMQALASHTHVPLHQGLN